MTTRNYEAMFLLENTAATADFEATAGKVDEILQKHGATLVRKEKWDERKLAYEIRGQRRATYYLVYFTADPAGLAGMNEDLRLTETVLRFLFLALEMSIEEHVAKRDVERERLAEDSRRSALGWSAGGRRPARGAKGGKSRGRKSHDDDEDDEFGGDYDGGDDDDGSDDMEEASERRAASKP